ncbi:MAG: hypothetical protein GY940_22825, partial [bacterium]|nr:hypothetical protein [bacterium]
MPEYLSPGVYVEEVAIGAKPIEGVSTSTTAFIGGAEKGPVLEPTLVTSYSQFELNFGELIGSPRIHLAYAVDAFFRNGGKRAYIVRVVSTNAAKAGHLVKNREAPTAATLFNVESLNVGGDGNSIKISTSGSSIATAVNVFKESVTVTGVPSGQDIPVTDSSGFAVGDKVTLTDATPTSVNVVIEEIKAGNVIKVAGDFSGLTINDLGTTPPTTDITLRMADIAVGDRNIRLEDTSRFSSGSIVHVDNTSVDEYGIVDAIDGKKLVLKTGVVNPYPLDTPDPQPTAGSVEFDLTITDGSDTETFAQLAVSPQHPRYFMRIIQSQLVSVTAA